MSGKEEVDKDVIREKIKEEAKKIKIREGSEGPY